MTVILTTNEADAERIAKLVTLARQHGLVNKDRALSLEMDLTACHENGCPLDLKRMVEIAEAGSAHRQWLSLIHDLGGIRQNLNRHDGKLTGHFSPHFTV